jgi:hypothetical protein
MKWLVRSGIALVALVVAIFALQIIASETGEVVVLHARDATGEVVETRLWVVDMDGAQYLRAGDAGSGWFGRLSANPEVEVERAGRAAAYLAVPEPARNAALNVLMREKYGWRDRIISLMVGDRDAAIPVRLEPR